MAFKTDLPPTKTAATGADVTWTIEAQDGVTPYTYKWQFKATTGGAVFVDIDSSVNPTAATASLVNHAVAANSAGTYRCIVTDNAGTEITSVESVLTVS